MEAMVVKGPHKVAHTEQVAAAEPQLVVVMVQQVLEVLVVLVSTPEV